MDFDDDIVDNDNNSQLTEFPEAKLLLAMFYQTIDDALHVPKKIKRKKRRDILVAKCDIKNIKSCLAS